jgi:hypothetical protein
LPDPSPSAIRELARNILARREYGRISENPDLFWLDWLHRLLAWIKVLRVNSPVLYWALMAALAIFVAVTIAQLVWSLRAALRAQAPATAISGNNGPPDLAAEAGQLAAAGRFLEAGHRLMIASFALLAARSVIDLRPDCSNRWIRAALRGSTLAQALAIEIGALVEQTERRWFGNRANEPDLYLQWRSVYQRLVAAAE